LCARVEHAREQNSGEGREHTSTTSKI
jgi:hypothetical protein